MTASNTAATAATISSSKPTPAEIRQVLGSTVKPLLELQGFSRLLETTARLQVTPRTHKPCKHTQRTTVFLADRCRDRVQQVIDSISTLGTETVDIHNLLQDAATSFEILGAYYKKLSIIDLFAILSLAERATGTVNTVERLVNDRLCRTESSQSADGLTVSDKNPGSDVSYLPLFAETSFANKLDLLSTMISTLLRNVSCSDGSSRELLTHSPSYFSGIARSILESLRVIHADISAEFQKRISEATDHLAFVDKLFANGVNFRASDVSSMNLIISEVEYILGELSGEISEFELKQKAGGDLAEDTLH